MSNLFDNLLDDSDDIIIENVIPAKRLRLDEPSVETPTSVETKICNIDEQSKGYSFIIT